jgi:hypothetical protein
MSARCHTTSKSFSLLGSNIYCVLGHAMAWARGRPVADPGMLGLSRPTDRAAARLSARRLKHP